MCRADTHIATFILLILVDLIYLTIFFYRVSTALTTCIFEVIFLSFSMARFARQNDQMRPKHLLPDMITFSMFTSDEIRQLSVVQVVTSITLDNLGYPIKGGLYDKTMGPMSERSDPCGTCCMGFAQCSGHFGHIELPLPLVNPLFHNVISTILKISCLNCFKLQIPCKFEQILVVTTFLYVCNGVLYFFGQTTSSVP